MAINVKKLFLYIIVSMLLVVLAVPANCFAASIDNYSGAAEVSAASAETESEVTGDDLEGSPALQSEDTAISETEDAVLSPAGAANAQNSLVDDLKEKVENRTDNNSESLNIEHRTETVTARPDGRYSGTLSSDTHKYIYEYSLAKSGRLTIKLHSDLEKVKVEFGNKGEVIAIDSSVVNMGDQVFTYDLAPGNYTFTVERELTHDGSFSFNSAFADANETYTDSNDTINAVRNSSAVPFDKVINGQLACNDETDFFRVDLPSSGNIRLNFHSDLTKVEVALYDSKDTAIRNGYLDRGDKTYSHDLTSGTYYVAVKRYTSEDTGTYRFSVGFTSAGETYAETIANENNNVNLVRSVNSIPLKTTIKGQLAVNDDCDIFKVTIKSAGKYTVKVNSSVEKIEMAMLDSDESEVASTAGKTYFVHKKGNSTYKFQLAKGTYYLKIKRYTNDFTGNYNFSVSKYITPAKVKIGKCTGGKKVLTVKWKPLKKNVSGYQVYYKNTLTGKVKKVSVKHTSKMNSKSSVSKKFKKLSRGVFKVRVRAYYKIGNSVRYGAWSKTKKIRVR